MPHLTSPRDPPTVAIDVGKPYMTTQNELMSLLVLSEAHHGVGCPQHPQQQHTDSSSVFLVTHPPLFFEMTDPLKTDNWLRTTKLKFSLLHYTKYQKTLYATQQLRG
jgi:hypothetical protein